MFNARVSDVTEVDVFSSNGITDEAHKTTILSDYLTSNGEDLDFDDNGNIIKGTEIFKSVDVVTTELSDFINKYDKTKLQGSSNANNKPDDHIDDEVSVVGYMRDLFEISITDEEGNEIAFEDTPEGIKNYFETIKPKVKETIKEEVIQELVKGDNYLIDLIDYYKRNNTIEGFIEKEYTYQNLDIIKMDDNAKRAVVGEYLRISNTDKNMIEVITKSLTGGETLNNAAQDAIKNLKKYEVDREKTKEERRLAAIKAAQETEQENLRVVTETLNSGSIMGYNIPKDKIAQFRDYLFKPIKDGKTQEMLDIENELQSMESKLLSAYRRFSKYDDKALLDAKVQSDKYESLKKNKFVIKSANTASTNKNNNFDKLGNVKLSNIKIENK